LGFKTDPDEKGTESLWNVISPRDDRRVSRLIPMKRELKVYNIPTIVGKRNYRFKTDPDEKGTES